MEVQLLQSMDLWQMLTSFLEMHAHKLMHLKCLAERATLQAHPLNEWKGG